MTDLVVKSNKLVQALQTLTLSETRLLQLAIVDARETGQGLSTDEPLELNALRYAKAFNVSPDAAYLALIEAEDSLFKIDGFEQYFTSYHLKKTADFKSVYAVRLYELLMQWKSVGKTPVYELNKFRSQLGIGVNEYTRMEAFKRRVLDIAVDQINEFSDITVKYEQHKKGRSISGFSFSFKPKKATIRSIETNRDPNTTDLFSRMTDKQRHLFATKLSELPEMGKYSQGTESYPQFAIRIAEMLQDSEKFQELFPYLQKVGYQAA